jgi:TusA-related sulfurtransferase
MEGMAMQREQNEGLSEALGKVLAERLASLVPGESTELFVDFPDAEVQAHNWCQSHGYQLLQAERQGERWRLRIQRSHGQNAPVCLVGRREALTWMVHALLASMLFSWFSSRCGKRQKVIRMAKH